MKQIDDHFFNLLVNNKLKISNNIVNRINDSYFQEKFNSVSKRVVSNEAEFNFFGINARKALEEARKNNVKTARAFLERSDAFITSPDNNVEAFLYNAVKNPISAYVLYKEGKFEEAIRLSHQIMEEDSVLEQDFPIFLFHKVQQLNNIVRIYFRNGKTYQGAAITKDILDFLIFDTAFSCNNIEFTTYSDDESRKLKIAMVYQIFFELVHHLNRKKIFDNQILQGFAAFADKGTNDAAYSGIIEWLLLKEKIAAGEQDIVSAFMEFLAVSEYFYSLDPLYNVLNSVLYTIEPDEMLRATVDKFIIENYD